MRQLRRLPVWLAVLVSLAMVSCACKTLMPIVQQATAYPTYTPHPTFTPPATYTPPPTYTPYPTYTPMLTALSPEQQYAHAMIPALAELNAWLHGPLMEWNVLLAKKWPDSGGDTTYGFMLFWCSSAPSLCDDPMWKELRETMVPAAVAIVEDGFEVKSSLAAVSPPAAVSAAHEQILSCVEYKVNTANGIVDFLQKAIMPSPSSGSDPCNLLDSATKKVTDFVENNR